MGEKFRIHLENIGPHKNLDYVDNNLKKMQIGLYARNGQGKTFISRAIRTLELESARYPDYALELLNDSANEGSFSIEIGKNKNSYNVSKSINNVNKEIDRIFYTFNSDYILENLVENHYNPNSDIKGFVLGKVNIDLSDDKNKIDGYNEKIKDLQIIITESIEKIKTEVQKQGITARLSAFKEINYDNLITYNNQYDIDYLKCITDITAFNNIDDDIRDLKNLSFSCRTIDEFDEIINILETSYSLNSYEDSFKLYVKENLDFIKQGNSLLEADNKCPYCKRELSGDALQLVHRYIEFVNDNESLITSQIKSYIQLIENDILSATNLNNTIDDSLEEMKPYSQFFGKLNKSDIESLQENIHKLVTWLESVKDNLNDKLSDLSKTISIQRFLSLKTLNKALNGINSQINSYNKKKNNTATQKRTLKNDLCHAAINYLYQSNQGNIELLSTYKTSVQDLKEEINKKQLQSRKTKKELVARDFEHNLNSFFHGKYTLDKDTFELSLNSKKIVNNTDKVLSDGEKTIVAFCYYLANIHSIVNDETQYNKVVLVIDDPISSMDIDYIYQMVSLIKNYGLNNETKNEKYIILTHNLDFFNLLSRQNVTTKNLYLDNHVIKEYKDELIMPYEFHLSDIYNVAVGNTDSSHTTANSIRHVLETICQFEGLSKEQRSLENVINSNNEFKENLGVYSFMEDLSHGRVRFESIENANMVKNACGAVIKFVEKKYPLQIEKCRLLERG